MLTRQLVMPSAWSSLSPGRARLARAGASAAGMAGAKVLQVAVSIITVPLMLTYLGKESYGLAMAIVGFSMLFCVGGGILEGVKLRLIECFARNDKSGAQAYASTGFFGILPVAAVSGFCLALAFPLVDWSRLFNLSEAAPVSPDMLRLIVAISLLAVMLLIPLSLLKEVYTAAQRGYVFSVFASIGTACSLAAIYAAVRFDLGMIGIVLGLQGSILLTHLGMWVFTFFGKLKWVLPRWRHVSREAFGTMWHDCVMTVLMASGFMIINGTDIVIVNHYLGQNDAATYSVSIRFFIYVEVLLSFVLYPLWPALGEAIQNGEREWVRRMSRRLLCVSIGSGAVLFFCVIMVGRPLIAFWTRDIIHPPLTLYVFLGVYYAIRVVTAVHVTLLRAHGRVRVQSIAQCCEAALHVTLCVLLVQKMGLTGVVFAGIISIAVTQAWLLPLEYRQVRRAYRESSTND